MEKVVRDGRVAVLISPGYGSGWSTWADEVHREWCLFAPELVAAVEDEDTETVAELAGQREDETGRHIHVGHNVEDLEIQWLPVGTAFCVDVYDGSESITTIEKLCFLA